MMKFTFLAENKTDNPGCSAEHGLSVYIETDTMKILFDTGSSALFAQNAEILGVDLGEVDAAVISHGHYDHTDGVPRFVEINTKAPIYVHQNAFGDFYGTSGEKIDEEPCGIRWDERQRQVIEPRLRLTDGPVWLTDDIVISGSIPDVTDMAPTEIFYRKEEEGLVRDDMSHEQFLAVRNGDQGVFVFSGCSHKGVVAALSYAQTLFPGEKIAGLIAGMHLYSAPDAMRRAVVEQVIAADPGFVMPVHCTGIDAICLLKSALGDQCIVATTGDTYVYGDQADGQ